MCYMPYNNDIHVPKGAEFFCIPLLSPLSPATLRATFNLHLPSPAVVSMTLLP